MLNVRDGVGARRKLPVRGRDDIPHDLAFAYPLKIAFENILGHKTYLKLKECHDLKVWKKQSERLLKASLLAFCANVEIADDDFKRDVSTVISHGVELVRLAETIDALFSSLAATYAQLSFLQLGTNMGRSNDATLRREDWKLNTTRTVMYVQTDVQKRNVSFNRQKRREGQERAEAMQAEKATGE